MARGEWVFHGRGKWGCSYKRTTLIVCFINIVVALYFLRSLYASLYIYSGNVSRNIVVYTPDQIRKMEESIQIRKALKPVELVKVVIELKKLIPKEDVVVNLPWHLKQKITDEILQRLKASSDNENITEQLEAVESWRKEKLKAAKKLALMKENLNSTISYKETGILIRALESDWDVLSEKLGLWIPVEVNNKEHDDLPEGMEEFEDEVLPGRPLPAECHPQLHTDYNGAAVRWGLTHHKDSAADCCQACLDHANRAKPGDMKCNIWVYCPSEFGCHSPDIYEHKHMECWLKYAEKPQLNFKDRYSESYRDSHPSAPVIVPWVSGVISS
ncbi:Methionine aminopeptidase 1D chloroplastic/mitochondrial [Quillaja saponaria]|uniref:Methionine aminopeptidase 1D chloroplastic/mitochondrial n=1 Tax=Quillaja saponaria TaxID=32244 RepID=A0AAD7PT86_QUISA|nr:Methionine aminopeptidase 1D chloroplastic/mitochondrial [Quillaja saponaria]